jgi:hypothetical protein
MSIYNAFLTYCLGADKPEWAKLASEQSFFEVERHCKLLNMLYTESIMLNTIL